MSLFEKIKNKRSSLQEKKDDEIKKPTKKANKEVFDVTGKSAARDAKKYSSGEYAKIGGGSRIGSKSKGPGAETGAKVNLNPTSGSKSKGTTPVKVNITKPIKQSEVSKKAKVFTAKVNKQRVKKQFPGDKSGAYQATKTDLETRKGFSKNKPGGLKADERNPFVKRSVRKARVDDLGGNIYDQPKFTDKDFKKSLKDVGKEGSKLRRARAQAFKDVQTDSPYMGTLPGSKPTFSKKSTFVKPSDPFAGSYDTPGQTKVKAMDKKAFKKTQPSDILKDPELSKTYGTKSFTDFSKKIKKLKTDVSKTASITPTVGVKQADVSRRAKKFSQNISNKVKLNKVQMRGGATNIPAGPTSPPKKYNIPADDRPGKLAQGRDFPSKRSYDAKLEKQIKTLRGKAANLRAAKMQASGEKIPGLRKTGLFSGKNVSSETRKKLASRQAERTRTADALERSLKRQGTKGPTSMLPVVSGKGADAKMPGMGEKSKMTYKQFYKAANVGAKQPPKVKSTPPPDTEFKKNVEDSFKKAQKKSKVTSSKFYGKYKDTARGQDILSKKATRLSRGFKGGTGKRAALGKFARSPLGKGLLGTTPKGRLVRAVGAIAAYQAGKYYLNRKDDLNINKDFAKTTTIKNPSGQNVRFKYSNKKDKFGNPTYKDQASSYLTKDQKNKIGGTIPGGLTKFRTGQYTANYKSGGKVGGRIDIDKNMRSSAFEKQLKKAEKGTGFLGKQTQKDKDFLRKYKDATRPTAVK